MVSQLLFRRVEGGRTLQMALILLPTIIQFGMQNSNASNRGSTSEFVWQEREGLQKIFNRVKQLSQIQDESQNQLSPASFQDDSLMKSATSSQPTRKQQHSRKQYNPLSDNDLRQSNIKLYEDNVKLFAECVRLRKLCQQNNNCSRDFGTKTGNAELLQKISRLQRSNEQLEAKVGSLQRELQITSLKQINKSESVSINSTHQSGKSEGQKDRMIKNMKIVHESQIRKLKIVIEGLREQLLKFNSREIPSYRK